MTHDGGVRQLRPWVACFLGALVLTTACSSDGGEAAESTTTVPDQVTEVPVVTEAPAVTRWSIAPALAADPNCPNPAAGVPIRIGYAADFSEAASLSQQSATEAALHLVKLINCSGGADGQPVDVQVVDASGSPVETRDSVNELLSAGAEAILGPPSVDPGLRILQMTDGSLPVLFPTAGDPALADPTRLSFLAGFDQTRAATASARFALDQGWGTAVTFSGPGSIFGHSPNIFARQFQAAGGVLVADYPYVPGETVDFAEAAGQMAAGPVPAVVFTAMPAEQVAALRSDLTAAGLTPEVIVAENFAATGGYTVDGLDGVHHPAQVVVEPAGRVAALNASYQAVNGEGFADPEAAALVADAMTIILDAYLRSDRATPEGVGAAIAQGTDIDGVTGIFGFDGGGSPTKAVHIHRVVGGQPTLVTSVNS